MKPSLTASTLVLVAVTLVQGGPWKQECDAILAAGFQCFDQASATRRASLPVSVGQVNNHYCNNLQQQMECLTQPTNCFTGFRRTVFGVVSQGTRGFLRSHCKNQSTRAKLARHMRCFANETTPTASLDLLVGQTTAVFDHISKQNGQQLTRSLCCGIGSLRQHIRVSAKKACDEKEVNLLGDHFYEALIDSALGPLLDTMCGQFESQEHCSTSDLGSEMFENIIQNPKLARKSESLGDALLSAINAFDE
ncbi:hypothetical protein HDE_03813 [Halotydeus destructor]|nr:hypothetical protein HDE_03813 [Halotydeus destructor]